MAIKGRNPKNKEKTRLLTVKKCNSADEIILGRFKDKYKIIINQRPNIICLGYDQKYFIKNLGQILAKRGLPNIKIKRLKPYRPKKYKSSILLKQHK